MSRLLPVVALLVACTADEVERSVADELGMTRYLGAADPVSESTDDDGVTTYDFGTSSRPRCMRGDPFRMSARDMGSEDLVIFMQGGGMCWSGLCFAVTKAPEGMPGVDILDTEMPENPAADWNAVYVPYCDGSLFAGDVDVDEDGDGTDDRFHRGLANLSATLDVAAEAFPAPRRVLFSGSSGGAFGVIYAMPLLRHVFPDSELIVMSDSGVGVAKGAADPTFVERILVEFGADELVPEDCPDCFANGHLTRFVDWYLERDPEVRVGVFSAWYDAIIADVFLEVDPADFRDDLAEETGRTHAAFPDRYRRFFIDGRMHTTIIGNPSGVVGSDLSAVELPPDVFSRLTDLDLGSLDETEADGYPLSDWLGGLLDGDLDVWTDITEAPGPAPE